ncbi:hypothetical protein TAMA11512_22880 [Selenomonas sp. TAMA-11512]|uniref:L,D-transpeptidase n=1 Tax=Selenomonas sp. TAMA-11512 TaxID=3095337 RepID=UPI00308F6D8D|nr:hypothetical protein TAMA11512_22880 [Selenomonas sp. TAMA-11512]
MGRFVWKIGIVGILAAVGIFSVSVLGGYRFAEGVVQDHRAQSLQESFRHLVAFGEEAEAKARGKRIVINIPSRQIALYENGQKTMRYPIAVGSLVSPTPEGEYRIEHKEINPEWVHPKQTKRRIPSGPANPLGYRWMQFYEVYGIHGTNQPSSIGRFVSNGCVRMLEPDVEALYDAIPVGTPLTIVYDRIVVERQPDGAVFLATHPDMYGKQPLERQAVHTALENYGLADFLHLDDPVFWGAIAKSSGESIPVGATYVLEADGKKLPVYATLYEGKLYIPVERLGRILNIETKWDPSRGEVASRYGRSYGVFFGDEVYTEPSALYGLFFLRAERDEEQRVLRLKLHIPEG